VLNKTSIKGNWCSQSRQRNANSQSDLSEKENATGDQREKRKTNFGFVPPFDLLELVGGISFQK